jgi:hypothetical protein
MESRIRNINNNYFLPKRILTNNLLSAIRINILLQRNKE